MSTEISTKTMGLHAVEVAFSGVAWFVAVMWLNSNISRRQQHKDELEETYHQGWRRWQNA